MDKEEIKRKLINCGEDPDEIETMSTEEMQEQLSDYEDTSDMFPNGQDED